jgi:hypothetical protein
VIGDGSAAAVAYAARPKASPGDEPLRVNGQLHHIAVGRTHDGTPVILLIDHLDVRIIRALTIEAKR